MKKIHPEVCTIICGLMVLTGCNSTQTVGFLPPDKKESLVASSETVVAGTVVGLERKPDYSASENLSAGAPADPKNGYSHHMTIKVNSVLKGSFSGAVLDFPNLKDPDKKDDLIDFKIYTNKQVYVGWTGSSDSPRNLKIVNAEPTTMP